MKRYLELSVIIVVCAVMISFGSNWWRESDSSQAPEPDPPPLRASTPSLAQEDGKLALNGVRLGDDVSELETRLGPPNFQWPERRMQQWEPRQGWFTRIAYDLGGNGKRTVTTVEASGTLSRDSERLIGFGDDKELMLKNLGQPTKVQDGFLYYYPELSISCQELVGMITLGDPVGMGGGRDEL